MESAFLFQASAVSRSDSASRRLPPAARTISVTASGSAETAVPPLATSSSRIRRSPPAISATAIGRKSRAAFAVVATGEPRGYGNIILTKGVIAG
jgi:L-fucose mutarotase/ribose pyranase (RbsD/FucU family)